jgi:hypothetical protein
MGLYDILKQKKNSDDLEKEKKAVLPEGEQVIAQTREEFIDFCESLKKDFNGVMKLYNRSEGKKYTAALLLDGGNIIGASFEDIDDKTIAYKEDAIVQIKKRLSGTRGDLEAYSFSEKDADRVRKTNQEAILKAAVPFSSLGMKIKGNIEEKHDIGLKGPQADYFSLKEGTRIKEMRVEEGFRLTDFARKFSLGIPEMPPQKPAIPKKEPPKIEKEDRPQSINDKKGLFSGLPGIPGIPGGDSDAKNERLEAMKKKRQLENMNLAKRISQITQKKQEGPKKETGKIETAIDKLYQLVQKYKRLKIDDELARRIGVSRSQIEGWALILEEHKLVELHYPAIGEPEIRAIEEKKGL